MLFFWNDFENGKRILARKTVLKEQSTHLKPELKSCENEDDNPKEIAVNTLNEVKKNEPFKPKILWLNVFFITLFHLIAFYALIFKVWETKFLTIIWGKTTFHKQRNQDGLL